ncbi:MAG: putative DNA-binding regulatory protein [Labilithrix sp.]|nr:putative DNA-binding regulatory protein [Labilithrix sp.]
MRALIAEARRALPPIALDDDVLEAHIARWSAAAGGAPVEVADLVLARACAAGEKPALAHFDATFAGDMTAALSTFRGDKAFADEVLQAVREKLFVGASPKILEYGGRGSLHAWLRAVVMRTALNARRRRIGDPTPSSGDDALLAVAAPAGDPELAQIVAKYGAAYKLAVHDALAELPPEDRNVLRLSLLEGLGIDAIARIYDVHRATVARWIGRARESVVEGARRRLGETTQLDEAELASIARACRTTLDLSLVRALERP